ncbi:Protein of unknown function [Leuconostoc citreum LBAE C11]|nr:Protein of unknown function [Leuconostoc citreum LBAE C11]
MLRRDLRYGLSHPKATLHTLAGTRISGNVKIDRLEYLSRECSSVG